LVQDLCRKGDNIMALTQDQIFMLANLADFAGQKLAPDNPFAGYAQNVVATRNFAKLLQQRGAQQGAQPGGKEGTPGGETPEGPSELALPNPFDPDYQPLQLPPKQTTPTKGGGIGDWSSERGYLPDIEPPAGTRPATPNTDSPSAPRIGDQTSDRGYLPDVTPPDEMGIWDRGVKATVDENNNVTTTHNDGGVTTTKKYPAKQAPGIPKKKQAPPAQQTSDVTNPFG
jgi:hypothetical protein